MFTGQFRYSVDVKGRVPIPAKLRRQFSPEAGNRVVINRGTLNYIEVYPIDQWSVIEKRIDNLDQYNPREAKLQRLLLQYVTEEEMDGQSRILLPQELIKLANIEKEVIILGQKNRIEIWNPDEYAKYMEGSDESLEQLAAELLTLK